ncbi:MAG: peptide ABC transporter substrate-binding protein, partial [Lachnospiraceae bacterium]|nr:peptide ABC transporter substrate-binding protein [Lachnospiraceae bacterium]
QPDAAKQYLEAAKAELGDSVNYPIQIDVVYLSTSEVNTAQAAAYKQVVEGCLGAANVQVNLIEASTTEDFYACGYRASNGAAGNFDMFYGSGWGPDYGDPSTYLDTFLGEGAGYMTKVIGLF